MGEPVATARVSGRRTLHFASLDDIGAEVERLAQARELRTLGNWSAGQVLDHLATTMHKSIDGFAHRPPAPVRFLVRLFFKRRILRRGMSAGFKLPAGAQVELGPAPTELAAGLASIRQALGRLRAETPTAAHPVLGVLTPDEWVQLHCRHAELHLSFLVPAA